MLKDLRLGLAVGGVLIAVVVAYVVFFTGGPAKTGKPGDTGTQPNSTNAGVDNGSRSNGSRSVASNTDLRGNPANSANTDSSAANNNGAGASASANTSANTSSSNNANSGSASVAVSDGTTPSATADWNAALDRGTISSLVARTETPSGNGGTTAGTSSGVGNAGASGSHDVSIPPETANANNGSSGNNISTPPAATGKRTCQVKQGDSLWTIAQREYGNGAYFTQILRANPGLDANRLKLGMTINLPDKSEVIPAASAARDAAAATVSNQPFDAAKHYKVQQGDSLYVISKRLYGKIDRVNKLYELNKDQIGPNPAALKKGMVLILPEAPTVAQNGGNAGNGVAGTPVQ